MTNEDLLTLLADAIQRRASSGVGNGSGVPRDPKLDDPATPPDERALRLAQYTGNLMATPQAQWNSSEKAAVQEQVNTVLRRDCGY